MSGDENGSPAEDDTPIPQLSGNHDRSEMNIELVYTALRELGQQQAAMNHRLLNIEMRMDRDRKDFLAAIQQLTARP